MVLKKAKQYSFKRVATAVMALVVIFLCGCGADTGERPDDTYVPSKTNARPTPAPVPLEPKNGGTLRISTGPYDTIDPLRTSNEDIRLFISALVCENLVDIGPNMLPEAHIVESWTCDDTYRIWELTMVKDAVFHSGDAAEAEDLKLLFDNILGYGGNYAQNLANVISCAVKDKYTLSVMLGEPDALFVNKLAIPFVGWRTLASEHAMVMDGTGIFAVSEFGGDRILLEKNTLYRDKSKLTYYDAVEISVFENENAKVNSDFDVLVLQGATVGADLLREGTSVHYFTGTGFDYIAVNCSPTFVLGTTGTSGGAEEKKYITLDNPFSEKRLRQVLNYVTSRENAVNKAASGHAAISLLPLYSGTAYRKQKTANFKYSPELAIALLKEIGYENRDDSWYLGDEELLVVAICPKRNYRMLTIMREAASGLREIEVKVELYELSDEEYLERLNNREYMMAAVETELGVWQDCGAIFGTSGELNYSFYSDRRVDDYIAQTRRNKDPETVAAAYAKIEEIILEDCPIAGMFIPDNALITSGRIEGVKEEFLRPWAPLAGIGEWWIGE